jgi:hypothetical protein
VLARIAKESPGAHAQPVSHQVFVGCVRAWFALTSANVLDELRIDRNGYVNVGAGCGDHCLGGQQSEIETLHKRFPVGLHGSSIVESQPPWKCRKSFRVRFTPPAPLALDDLHPTSRDYGFGSPGVNAPGSPGVNGSGSPGANGIGPGAGPGLGIRSSGGCPPGGIPSVGKTGSLQKPFGAMWSLQKFVESITTM